MNSYRVTFEDSHKGQTFKFAIVYRAKGIKTVRAMAALEFPDCPIVKIYTDMN